MSTQYYVPPYNSALAWNKFDIVYDGAYHYATADHAAGGANSDPTLQVSYNVFAHQRTDDIATIYFTQTGTVANFQRGSIVKAEGLTNTSMNYTGMAYDGGPNWVSYINAGWSEGSGASNGTVGGLNPAFTTGHFFSPTYTSKIDVENPAIVTQLGEGYSQRMRRGPLNTFNQSLSLVYQNRSAKEMKALVNFSEDHAGADAVEIMIPDTAISNQPSHKYILSNIQVTPVSFNLYDVTENATRVFDL